MAATRFSLQERNVKAGTTINVSGAGTLIKIDGGDAIKQALDTVRSTSTTNWALFGYVDNNQYDTVKLIATGTGGGTELSNYLNDNIVAYGLIRVEDNIDGRVNTQRYVYINWIGDGVPAMKKAKIGTNKASVTEIVGHYNMEITADTKSEITAEAIQDKVYSTTGSKSTAKNPWEFQQTESKKTEKKAASHVPTQSTVLFLNEDAIRNALKDVRNDNSATNWMLTRYTKDGRLELMGTGSGDISEVAAKFTDDNVYYGLIRVQQKIDASTTIKFIYLHFIGENLAPRLRGIISTHKGAVDEVFYPSHTKIFGSSLDLFTPNWVQEILKELKK